MRIVFIACFSLVAELHSRSLDAVEKKELKENLEREALESGGKYHFPRFFSPWYEEPQGVLNDSVFATVEEYLDGYTGYMCSTEGKIRYTLEPCSQHVWECSDGKLFKKTCAGSSVFWFAEGTCDSTRSQESTCKQKKKHVRGLYWPPNFIHIAKFRNVTELASLAPGSSPTLITIDCRKYEIARFAIKKCHPEYIKCYDGVRFMETCPPDWLFEERIKMCVPKEYCGAPTLPYSINPSPPVLFDDTPVNAERIRKLSADPILITIDCKMRSNSNFEIEKCHPSYIVCMDGARAMDSCFDGKVYTRENGCVDLKECEEAWRKDETTTFTPIVEQEEKEEFPGLPEKMILVPNAEDCVGKFGRRFAMKPCQAEYMYCFMDTGYKLKCSDGFVFSRRYLTCVGKEFCDI
ncbi:hypothetical protein CAEBREN_20244 [Caenorhabditis brenneri]|uniref:Chitin-binding type-2 domain-containing protein n=1 Tax=Caenorhabditis brenneri TaxID=135651 RepID=G0NXH8_CAEBE|nr:hypothetical protein CAEBREN_20244 [Caenorhabditis brenneri]